ncbi:element excision factor XisH family protein [Leptolyngbya sp. 'hensonii']|uniref:element excision factor XisH family protein n=1 Tax=Leptolyngbya sp. 'hensonii' TaxID=1922337 RepID=UPI0009F955DE
MHSRILYLAVPNDIYNRFFVTPFIKELVEQTELNLLIYDIDQVVIKRWIP